MRLWTTLAAALLLALLSSCGGDGRAGTTSGNQSEVPAGQQPGKGRSISLALSASTQSDGLLRATLKVSGADTLHQMSLRLAYDPRAVRPVEVERGALVDQRAVFFSAADRPAAQAGAYVPVAFTYHQGEQIPSGNGELLSARFEVLESGRDPGLQLITSPDFLIARDRSGADMQVLTGAGDE